MTVRYRAGALPGGVRWKEIDWKAAERQVRRLQMRIAKAISKGKYSKAKALQWTLTHSFYAKAVAVKRVTSNPGKRTPGVDGVLWKSPRTKIEAVYDLKRHGYKAKPLRRIYIPKKNGKLRPLSIPTMHDRAMQALYKLALSPVAETLADRNSYGFREGRRCADAIAAAFNALSKPNSAPYVLEGDIRGCFDNISNKWLLDNIPMDKAILRQFLEAGYVENGAVFPTLKGTPQGGIISPVLSNMTLDGLERVIHSAVPRRSRVNFVRYADDFIVTGKSLTLLEKKIKPAIEAYLKERGLELSAEKTVTSHIKDGFTFLGQSFRKTGGILRIKPSKEGTLALMREAKDLIRQHRSSPMEQLIKKLNHRLLGWANYHKHVVSSETFNRVDKYVYEQLWRMTRRRHPNKSRRWLARKYWTGAGQGHVFTATRKCKGKSTLLQVVRVSSIAIKRHIKIKADANPYMRQYAGYFWRRRHIGEARQTRTQSPRSISSKTALEV